jgi:RsiW-degrading membrane proteinase PrsW (M82 family)
MFFFLPLAFALAVLPAIGLIVYINRLDKKRPEPRGLIVKSVLFGFLAVLPAILAEIAIGAILPPMGNWLGAAVNGFLVAGLIEESIKYFFVNRFFFRLREFDEVADGIVFTACVSLGFALVENLMYAFDDNWGYVLLLRSITAVPMHAAASGIMGYYIGMSKMGRGDQRGKGLALAVAIHGFYDFCAFSQSLLSFLIIPVVAVALYVLKGLFRKAVATDNAAAATDAKSASGFGKA